MQKQLNKLIQKYKKYSTKGEKNLQELKALGDTSSCEYKKQKVIIVIWGLFLKDLCELADKEHDANKQTDQSSKSGPSGNGPMSKRRV